MKKKILRLWPIAASVALVACSESFDGPDLPSKDKSPMEALLGDFYASVHPGSRAEAPFEIIGVSKKTYRVENDSAIEVTGTRCLDGETFDVKVATLKFDNSLGYTVFPGDARPNRVFFFTENGNIADTADIQPLKELIDCAPYIAIETMQVEPENGTRTEERVYIDNICRFQWGQGTPYNWYGSVCNCICCSSFWGGQTPMGCSTVAVAQAIATMGTFHGTYYGNKDLDFSKMLSSYLGATVEQKWQISGYMHEIAHGCQVKYGCAGKGGSKTTLKAAYRYLKDLGFDCDFSEKSLDVNRVIVGLKKGIPLLMRGGEGEDGHQWIITGICKQTYGYDFWANWGRDGFSDGWCAGNPYTSNDKSEYYPKDHKYVYFNSKLK